MSQVFPLVLVWHQLVIHSYLRYSDHLILLSIIIPGQSWPFYSDFNMCQLYPGKCKWARIIHFTLFLTPYLQTYGSGNLKRVGVILQRGVLILLLACFPCWALLINTQPILLAVRQSPEVARWCISTSNMASGIKCYIHPFSLCESNKSV